MDGHGNEVGAVEDFRLPTDEDELRELAAAGIVLDPDSDGGLLLDVSTAKDEDIARVAGAASFFLRRIAVAEAEQAQLQRQRQFEEARLERVYGPLLAAAKQRAIHFTARVKELTDLAQGIGAFEKKKSIATGGGTFGIRKVAAKPKIMDPEALVDWAEDAMPNAVRITLETTLEQLDAMMIPYGDQHPDEPLPYKEKKREVLITALQEEGVAFDTVEIPGIAVMPPTTEYVIKPLPEGA